MNIRVETDSSVGGSIITGRNGTHPLAAIKIAQCWCGLTIEGIGKSGKLLNAGIYLTQEDGNKLCRVLKEYFDGTS